MLSTVSTDGYLHIFLLATGEHKAYPESENCTFCPNISFIYSSSEIQLLIACFPRLYYDLQLLLIRSHSAILAQNVPPFDWH